MRRLALTVLVCLTAIASAAGADVIVTTVDTPTMLSAYGPGLLFSQRNPVTGAYQLAYAESGRPPAPLPGVPERSIPFDADLGPGPDGRPLAVYSRCAQEPVYDPINEAGVPQYAKARGCDLYEYDLLRQQERKLVNASSTEGSEVLPTVWKDRIAFARIYAEDPIPVVYERPRTTGEPSRRMPSGPRTTRFARPTALELYGRRLALAWQYDGGRDSPASQIRLDDTQTKAVTILDIFRGGGLTTIQRDAPAFESGTLYFARLCKGDPGGCRDRSGLVRLRYSTGALTIAPIGREDLWQARGAGVTYILRDRGFLRSCTQPDPNISRPIGCDVLATTPTYG